MATEIWEHTSNLLAGCIEEPSCDGVLALKSADLDWEMSQTFLSRWCSKKWMRVLINNTTDFSNVGSSRKISA